MYVCMYKCVYMYVYTHIYIQQYYHIIILVVVSHYSPIISCQFENIISQMIVITAANLVTVAPIDITSERKMLFIQSDE